MDLLSLLRTQVRANRLANHRLHGAIRELPQAEYASPRTGFFPSLAKTLRHILAVDRVQRERRGHVVAHLLAHQVHHRGQVHAMLAGTSVPPPQLDEFLMPSEAHLRLADLRAAGWNESDLFLSASDVQQAAHREILHYEGKLHQEGDADPSARSETSR